MFQYSSNNKNLPPRIKLKKKISNMRFTQHIDSLSDSIAKYFRNKHTKINKTFAISEKPSCFFFPGNYEKLIELTLSCSISSLHKIVPVSEFWFRLKRGYPSLSEKTACAVTICNNLILMKLALLHMP